MKTAIYFEDGICQIVLTPENDFEKNLMKNINAKEMNASIFNGSFYECQGGWNRMHGYPSDSDKSIIIRLDDKLKELTK